MFKKISTVVAFLVASVLITAAITFVILFSQAPAHQAATADPETKFLKLVRENVKDNYVWTDEELVTTAKAACGALEAGGTIRQISYLIATADSVDSSNLERISSVVGYGISAYCPELG
jgi:hypothetical protein